MGVLDSVTEFLGLTKKNTAAVPNSAVDVSPAPAPIGGRRRSRRNQNHRRKNQSRKHRRQNHK